MDGHSAPTNHTKQYVFVDEYNRHKRLKVMRACDGCRKRKIRCDGALQNGPWPCGACVRLKLKCVPPSLDVDEEQQQPTTGQFTFPATVQGRRPTPDWPQAPLPAALDVGMYQAPMLTHPPPRLDSSLGGDDFFASPYGPSALGYMGATTETPGSSASDAQDMNDNVKELTGQMGDLSIEVTSVAPWIANEKRALEGTPVVEENDVLLPPSVSADSTVRVPPEMMPSEERAMQYFHYFFEHVHPYVPVLNREHFYRQWQTSRMQISPLLLEGIFACATRYLEEPIEARKWLALAARHEESFKDVPRLSTIQALLLLTKAREFQPRRGYFYRSWMTVKYMIGMAMDLLLHEHYDNHRGAIRCKKPREECLVLMRIWHTLFGLEILVGAPQGRTDFAIEAETLDFNEPIATPDVNPYEISVSRRTVYMSQVFRNIKQTNKLWQRMRRYKSDWALDPAFVRHNKDLTTWLAQVPSDLQLHYPDDDSAPWLGGDHFVAYIHIYHHLVVIMHHRPQLQALLERRDANFKTHLEECVSSATYLCRVQEALVREFDLDGLNFMQRGINFTIYCALTCMMLHLASITCPDAELNKTGREFFVRQMRILEKCIPSASPELKAQINSLREAFSNDISMPFELKPTLGLRSPSMGSQSSSPGMRRDTPTRQSSSAATWAAASSKTLSPATDYTTSFDTVVDYHRYPAESSPEHDGLQCSAPPTGYSLEQVIFNEQHQPPPPVWDPSGIFQQWNSAFGPPVQPPPSMSQQAALQAVTAPSVAAMYGTPTNIAGHHVAAAQLSPEPAISTAPTVTSLMWQDAFTTAYVSGHGNKRYRSHNTDGHGDYGGFTKRRG
ncbi:hypothetical protein K470DRAFT_223646 [Piedraia hortae CBS 480.64]|uniref:Zn(2)-C6 fungal-type domain-containing protein n=1 Tax=Piedraia hortae CBS 480.64 TaxID=1314780 RepID=A0A6A7BPM0_9PEZI|nr:hypothetical protein K470DRAFT_223646 [Piedraia hortae CBS 480.64]